jgi:hypothetical protein
MAISDRPQPLSLNVRLDRIAQHIVRARLFFDLWFYFEGQGTRPQIIETMREYNEFFRFTPHAYLVTYIIYMAGVFDKRKDTINLPKLVREVGKNGTLTALEISAVNGLLAKANRIANKVAILRHGAFAHRSAHISYNDVFTLADVKPDQLRDLTDIALEATNHLLSAQKLQKQHFTSLPREAAHAMMEVLGSR